MELVSENVISFCGSEEFLVRSNILHFIAGMIRLLLSRQIDGAPGR
jgi:hypothetical protein